MKSRGILSMFALSLAILALTLLARPATGQDKPDSGKGVKVEEKKDGKHSHAIEIKSFEEILKDSGLTYSKREINKRPVFRIAVEAGGETTMVTAEERVWSPWVYPRKDGSVLKSIYCYATVAPLQKDQRVSPAVLKVIADLNDRFLLANCSLAPDGIFINKGFYLPGLDGDLLHYHIYDVHWRRLQARKAILPILEAEKTEKP